MTPILGKGGGVVSRNRARRGGGKGVQVEVEVELEVGWSPLPPEARGWGGQRPVTSAVQGPLSGAADALERSERNGRAVCLAVAIRPDERVKIKHRDLLVFTLRLKLGCDSALSSPC